MRNWVQFKFSIMEVINEFGYVYENSTRKKDEAISYWKNDSL